MLSSWGRTPSFRKVVYCVLGFYLVVTCLYGVHKLRNSLVFTGESKAAESKSISIADVVDDPDWNPWGEEFESEVGFPQRHQPPELWRPEEEPQVEKVDQTPRPQDERNRRVSFESGHDSGPQDEQGREVWSHVGRDPTRSQEDQGRRVKDLVTKNPMSAQAADGVLNIVEVWGKAAIGLYLWQHILDAELEDRLNGVWQYGEKTVGSIKFRFRTGPGVVPTKVPRDTENLLLVINGRSSSKIEAGKVWLDSLPAFPRLKNVAMVMLGMEDCDNSWFHPYLESHGGRVKALFVVYDSPDVDNINVFQWPLGVATYRDFPVIQNFDLYSEKPRRYMFNFLGTIYPNSSRETLLTVVKNSPHRDLGYVKTRANWQPDESPESRGQFLYTLGNSDLTLNPVGINTECYRIYEAMAMGSVPVVEDIMTPGHCGNSSVSGKSNQLQSSLKSPPLRLLKEFDAPVIFVRDWTTDLRKVLDREAAMSPEEKMVRHRAILRWYAGFLAKMKLRLVSILQDKFFQPSV